MDETPPECQPLVWGEVQQRFAEEEKRNGLPRGLLGAVAMQESALSPCAVSRAGAQGLMQLMPSTASGLGVADTFDPWRNLAAGGDLLRQLLMRYGGDLRLALGAYNAGPARVDAYGGIPPFVETQNYVQDVLARMQLSTSLDNPVKP